LLSWHIPIFLPTNSLPESSPFVQCFIALNCEIFLCDFSAACRSFLYRFSWQTENICQAGTTSIPIPQREESENIPLPDLPGQLENVQQSGNEIAERGMPT